MKRTAVLVLLLSVFTACHPAAAPQVSSTPEPTIEVPTALPLSLLTPQITATSDTARIPVRIENVRAAYAAYITVTDGPIEQISIPATTAGYWHGSPPLGRGGNTVIIGFEIPGILSTLASTKVGDELLITDQEGLTAIYRVTAAEPINDIISPAKPANSDQVTLIGVSEDLTFFKVVAVSAS